MNKTFITAILLLLASTAFANHLKGGFFTYQYLGTANGDPNQLRYHVKLTVYMDCGATAEQASPSVNFTFFDAGTNAVVRNLTINKTNDYTIGKDQDEECISGDQRGCYYRILEYDLAEVTLPKNGAGYTIAYQRCCRIGGIVNIISSNQIGNTYAITIPGTDVSPTAPENSSAKFLVNDTYVVCGGTFFTFPVTATDPNGDDLSYQFCSAWVGGSQAAPAPDVASAPPFGIVPYQSGFTGDKPLGANVSIDSKTGVISGIAPSFPGEYVITVCVNEIKGGKVIASTRKELHMRVGSCVPIKAVLEPAYSVCKDYTISLFNKQHSSEIRSYFWDFGDGTTSTEVAPKHTYAAAGSYTIKLVINKGESCESSTTAVANVFPKFVPDFDIRGLCINKPSRFTDKTTTTFGSVNSWSWDFGDDQTTADVSNLQNPTYTFTQIKTYNVRLIATSTNGCRDTVTKPVEILDKPPLSVAFKDTLICKGDEVPLRAIGQGNFTWTPTATLTGANTATPTAAPAVTTTYNVQLEDDGCINNDTVRVRVVNFVTLQANADTVICAGDSVRLGATTNGLKFLWTPSTTISDPTLLSPNALPDATTTYNIHATIGHCVADDEMVVKLVPYPVANAGADTTICFATKAQLNATIDASTFVWSPSETLANANTLSPVASPVGTTAYVLTVRDNKGCPKPVSDTVVVNVLPEVYAFAGRDTAVVVGQPLQFNATGGVTYTWSPATSLSDPNIANPVGVYDGSFENIRYNLLVADEIGCTDTASVNVRIFKTDPRIFVPTAFTPNGDGKNDTFKPIAVGISSIQYFRVFNRWGQMVFNTTANGNGWDGKINGKDQGSGTFVWVVKGVDFTGKEFFAKGTVTLVR